MEVSEGIDAVAGLRKARAEGEAARRQRLESIEIQDEKGLMERTTALLARNESVKGGQAGQLTP